MKYDKYHLEWKDWLLVILSFLLLDIIVSFIFYDSYIFGFLIVPLLIPYIKIYKTIRLQRVREEIDKEFLKALSSISSSLCAGLSAENAFVDAEEDMERLYGSKSIITKELRIINKRVSNREGLSDALSDFAMKSKSDAIEDFALVFRVASNCGGGFARVIQNCVNVIQTNQQIKEEARVLIRGRQVEQRVMSVIPIGIILYLRFSSGSFMSVLYHNILGIVVMTICLLLYIFSMFMSSRICNIKV